MADADGGPSGQECDEGYAVYVNPGQGGQVTLTHQQARQTHFSVTGGGGGSLTAPGTTQGATGELQPQYVTAAAAVPIAAPMMAQHPGSLGEGAPVYNPTTAVAAAGPQATPQPLGPVEWKMLEMDLSAAISLSALDELDRVWTLKVSKLIDKAPWKDQLKNSKQRVGGLEVIEAEHNFPFQIGVRLVLSDPVTSKSSGSEIGDKNSGSTNKLPAGKYIVTAKEPVTFSLRPGQKIKPKEPVRVLVAPQTLEKSILSSYGNRQGTQEPIWTPSNIRKGIAAHPTHRPTLSMVDANHPIMHQIEAEKKRNSGDAWKLHAPDGSGLYQVANEDIERHIKFLEEDWSKSIKMQDLMNLEIQIERATIEGEASGEDTETIWLNPAEICDGIDLTSQSGLKAQEKLGTSKKKYRIYLTLGIEYADVF